MYSVSIYDKTKKIVASYERIHTIKYTDVLGETITVTGDKLLTHAFPTSRSLQLLSDDGNYCIDPSVIGTFEVKTVTH